MARKPPASKKRNARRRRLHRQQGGLCGGCRQPIAIDQVTFDHVLPQSRGGTDDYRNQMALCRPCNAFKANHWPWNWDDYVWDPYTRSLKTRAEVEGYYHKK